MPRLSEPLPKKPEPSFPPSYDEVMADTTHTPPPYQSATRINSRDEWKRDWWKTLCCPCRCILGSIELFCCCDDMHPTTASRVPDTRTQTRTTVTEPRFTYNKPYNALATSAMHSTAWSSSRRAHNSGHFRSNDSYDGGQPLANGDNDYTDYDNCKSDSDRHDDNYRSDSDRHSGGHHSSRDDGHCSTSDDTRCDSGGGDTGGGCDSGGGGDSGGCDSGGGDSGGGCCD